MKIFLNFAAALFAVAATAAVHAQGFAPKSIIGNTLLNSTLTGSTGGANSDGSFTDQIGRAHV